VQYSSIAFYETAATRFIFFFSIADSRQKEKIFPRCDGVIFHFLIHFLFKFVTFYRLNEYFRLLLFCKTNNSSIRKYIALLEIKKNKTERIVSVFGGDT